MWGKGDLFRRKLVGFWFVLLWVFFWASLVGLTSWVFFNWCLLEELKSLKKKKNLSPNCLIGGASAKIRKPFWFSFYTELKSLPLKKKKSTNCHIVLGNSSCLQIDQANRRQSYFLGKSLLVFCICFFLHDLKANIFLMFVEHPHCIYCVKVVDTGNKCVPQY